MLSRRTLSVSGLALALAGCFSREPRPYPRDPSATAAAGRALHDLSVLITDRDFAAFGFRSLSEVAEAKLDNPLDVFDIGVDRLRAYTPGTPVEGLLVKSNTTLFPVSVGGAVRSSVAVVQTKDGFRPSQMGEAPVMQTLAKYRRPGPNVEEFVVRVAGLNITLLGRRRGESLFLLLLFARQDLALPVGEDRPAQEVVALMVPLALKVNGQPS